MSAIRRQSIISSLIVYIGFAIGFINTYLFTRQGGFTKEQYGLTGTFTAIASVMYSVASLGMPVYISKFFPYYQAHLEERKNEQMTLAFLISCLGFILVTVVGIVFKPIIIERKFGHSPELLKYYYWIFPFAFGFTLFTVFDSFALQKRKAILSNFAKEIVFRLATTTLILLTMLKVIRDFSIFISIYSFIYLMLIAGLVIYFLRKGYLHFTFRISRVTQKFRKKIITLASFIWAGNLVFTLANVFDVIVLAAVMPNGMAAAGIFTLGQYISSLIQAPQRAVISASIGALSQSWREKDYEKINKIYHRSSINQLIFACFMFSLIWMNFDDAIPAFHLQTSYLAAKWVFLFIGLTRIIDMGTGLNSQIIATSSFWRVEFFSGLFLLALTIPLDYILAKTLGIAGPALATLITLTLYNLIRYIFLLRRFRMQPFNLKTLLTLVWSIAAFMLSYVFFRNIHGFTGIILRSGTFFIFYITGVFAFKLSPDLKPVLATVQKRLGLQA